MTVVIDPALLPILGTVITAGGVVFAAYLALRGVLRNAGVQEREVRTAERRQDLEGALAIADKWKEYSDNLEGRLGAQDASMAVANEAIKRLEATTAEYDSRIRTLETTVNVAAAHIADVHDWAEFSGLNDIPTIPAVIIPLVSPMRRPITPGGSHV